MLQNIYWVDSSHCRIGGLRSSLTLYIWREVCFLNLKIQRRIMEAVPSKILLFRTFQISHAAMIKISTKNCICKNTLSSVILLWISNALSHVIPNLFQQATTNGHVKKRCLMVSSSALEHSTQLLPSAWIWKYLLLSYWCFIPATLPREYIARLSHPEPSTRRWQETLLDRFGLQCVIPYVL